MAAFSGNELLGLQPALDARKVQKPHVVSGTNFLMDLEGPRSGFAFESTVPNFPIFHKFLVQDFKISDEQLFYFGQDIESSTAGVYTCDWESRIVIPLFELAMQQAYLRYPWSMALVGSYYFFANRAYGVLMYDQIADTWTDVTANFPSETFFITESSGRCIALATGVIAWSAIDDGNDFVPNPATGAGFQSTALVGSLTRASDYIGLKRLADGFIGFTSRGTLRGTAVDAPTPFRIKASRSTNIPMNPWCFAEIADDVHVILTVNGLYVTQTGEFEVWQPIFSEYAKQTLLPEIPQAVTGRVQLHYDSRYQLLFLSLSSSIDFIYFTKAYCLYVPRGEWGSFDRTHTAFVNIDQLIDAKLLSFGFVTRDGTIAAFTFGTQDLYNSGDEDSFLHFSRFAPAGFKFGTVYYFSDMAYELTAAPYFNQVLHSGYSISLPQNFIRDSYPRFYPRFAFDSMFEWSVIVDLEDETVEFIFTDSMTHAAILWIFPLDANVAYRLQEADWIPNDIQTASLDSTIEIGLFRFSDGEAVDELSLVTDLLIGVDASSGVTVTEDCMLTTGDVIDDLFLDYATDVVEDCGQGLGTSAEFVETVIGTKDGDTVFEGQEVVFETVEITSGSRRKTGQCAGIWHKIRITATEMGHNFHIKLVEFNYFIMGRW